MMQLHHPPKVLIVDDESTITNTLVKIFSKRGYDTRGVYSAEEARRLILEWSPDLAVIDVRLPEMNGVEFAILLKAEFPKSRLILFSGQPSTSDLINFAKDQGHDFEVLAKPIHPEQLLDWADKQQPSSSEELN